MKMNQVINVVNKEINGESVNTVNARDLHQALEVGRDFSTWITDRIEKLGFVEGIDYCIIEDLMSPVSGSTKARVRTLIEYHVSVEMAKHLAMIQNNVKGFEVRNYFIQCEKKAKSNLQLLPQDYVSALKALVVSEENKIAALTQLKEAQPKIVFHDTVTASVGTQTMEEVAKSLCIGRNTLFKRLRDEGVLTKDNLPLQYYLDRKWFEVVTYPYVRHRW
jgi:anti-repressor protein